MEEKTLSELLYEDRISKNLSVVAYAVKIGIATTIVSQIIAKTYNKKLQPRVIGKIAKELNLSSQEVLKAYQKQL